MEGNSINYLLNDEKKFVTQAKSLDLMTAFPALIGALTQTFAPVLT